MGGDGSLLITHDKTVHIPASKLTAPVIDTAGAGDCFLGSFAYFLSRDVPIEQCMEYASHIAGISVTRKGTQTSYPSIHELPRNFFPNPSNL